jgi:hypothetical protein
MADTFRRLSAGSSTGPGESIAGRPEKREADTASLLVKRPPGKSYLYSDLGAIVKGLGMLLR